MRKPTPNGYDKIDVGAALSGKARSRITSILLAAMMLVILAPFPVAIATGCVIGAGNTVAGLGTQVTFKGCTPNKSHMLVMYPPSGVAYTQAVVTDDAGSAATLIPGKSAIVAGTYQLQVDDVTASFTVAPDKVDDANSTLSATARSIAVGGSLSVTAMLLDRYRNPVSQRPVIALISNRPQDRIDADAQQSDASGRMSWTVQSSTPGLMTLTAYDVLSAKALSTRLDIAVGSSVAAAPVSYYEAPSYRAQLTGGERGGTLPVAKFDARLDKLSTSVSANEQFTVILTALDATGEIVQSYVGPVVIKSSDPSAEFPRKDSDPSSPGTGRVDFREVDLGERRIPLGFQLRTGGMQTIEFYAMNNPSIGGKLTVEVMRGSSSGGGEILIDEPLAEAIIRPTLDPTGGRTIKVKGKAPSLINLVVEGGVGQVNGESKADYSFEIEVPLDPKHKEVTLIVAAEDGGLRSNPVHFYIDLDPPVLTNVKIDPETGLTEEPATITVETEPGLTTVTATVDKTAMPMKETASGTYTTVFTPPNEEKTFEFIFDAVDTVGNKATPLKMQWSTRRKKPGKVLEVRAESQPNGVMVRWLPPEGKLSIGEYKIYIADANDAGNFLYSVSTKKPVTSALIKDLEVGRIYEFTLTAVSTEGQESEEYSDPAQAGPQGLKLTANPGNGKVFLEWVPPLSLPLAQYILKYGTEPQDYLETRTLNPALRNHEVPDLINGVTYEFRLTPVDVTGKVRDDLSVVVHATPGGDAGFHPGAGDPVPPNVFGNPPDTPEPEPDYENTTNSGLPTTMLAAVLAMAAILGLFWKHYMRQRKMANEFLRMMEHRYHSK